MNNRYVIVSKATGKRIGGVMSYGIAMARYSAMIKEDATAEELRQYDNFIFTNREAAVALQQKWEARCAFKFMAYRDYAVCK